MFIYRIVSLDLGANMSAEVEILCNLNNCGLMNPVSMAMVKDHIYIYQLMHKISVFESESNNAFITRVAKQLPSTIVLSKFI